VMRKDELWISVPLAVGSIGRGVEASMKIVVGLLAAIHGAVYVLLQTPSIP